MGHDFTVSFAIENSFGEKILFDLTMSPNNAIMHNICRSIRAKMRVSILGNFLPTSCPSRVSDPDVSICYSLADFTHKSIYAV